MVWAAPALAAATLCLRVSTEPVKAAAAALIIGAILANAEHPRLPSSLPVEFPCIPTGDPPAAEILAFARGLQSEPGELSSAQLSCLARLLAAKNLTADFGSFPPDLLLFFHPSEVRAGSCREFYARASRGNLELLPRGSAQRTRLLRGALTCLGVRGSRLESQQLGSLGALVCDLEPATIPASGPAILDSLKLCPALTGAQQDALNALLLTGDTAYGDPPSWDLRTLQDLGPLVLALNQTTLSLVAEAAREEFRRSIVAAYSSQGHSQREKSLILFRAFVAASAASQPRLKRSADRCPSEPITESIPFLTPEELDLCLSSDFLIANLEDVLDQPVTSQSFKILKKKVDQFFPSGIPEEQLKRLGGLSRLYTEQEISQWPLRCSDTLSALLSPSGGEWDDSQVQQLVSRYLALGGSLTGSLLWEIGGRRLCNLQEEQIQQIPAEAIMTTGQLNISLCSQSKKDQLYRKAREAFAILASTPRPYYCRIQPYLGGAPAEGLKDFANSGVAINMDLDTFLTLNPKELQKLSVTDVKNLLGKNLPELKEAENEPSVVSWVKRQPQWELDCVLGIGLQGGLQEPPGTASPACPTTPASTTSMVTVTSMATATTSAHPNTSASVTSTATSPMPTSLPTVPTSPHPSANVTVPTPIAITSLLTPQSSTVPPRTPTLSSPSPTPPATPPHTGGPTVPTATRTARPALTTRAPCSTPDRATSPTVPLLAPSTTSPSASPVPAVTSRASTSAGVGTNPAGTTHSTVTPVPNFSSAPTVTHNTITTVPNTSSAPTATSVPPSTSVPTATDSTATPVPPSTSVPTVTHSTVPNPSSAPTAISVPHSTSVPAATTAPHSTPSPHKPNSTISTQTSPGSPTAEPTTLPCQTSSPPGFPSSSSTTKPTPGGVPESPRPTSNGHINLHPEPGSGSRLSSCLVPVLAATIGNILLRGLL